MNTMFWLHSFTVDGEKRQVVHGHNAVADYRDLAPDATAQQIDVAAVAELIEADKEFDTARESWSGEKYEGDDYGVHGSDFIRCLCCGNESGAGILNQGVVHEPDCEVAALERAESRRFTALARCGGAE